LALQLIFCLKCLNNAKFGQLILGKIVKMAASMQTSYFEAKCTQTSFLDLRGSTSKRKRCGRDGGEEIEGEENPKRNVTGPILTNELIWTVRRR